MDDARRFLRFVVPGFVYALQTAAFTWVLFPAWTVERLSSFREGVGFGAAITAVFASGAVGYVLGVLHHFMHNRLQWRAAIDHSGILTRLISNDKLRLVEIGAEARPAQTSAVLTRDEALRVVTSLWYQRLKACELVQGAEPKLSALQDVAHASGTARIATVAAVLSTLVIAREISHVEIAAEPVVRLFVMLAISALSIGLFWETYYRVGNLAQRVIDEVLADALAREAARNGQPPETHWIR